MLLSKCLDFVDAGNHHHDNYINNKNCAVGEERYHHRHGWRLEIANGGSQRQQKPIPSNISLAARRLLFPPLF